MYKEEDGYESLTDYQPPDQRKEEKTFAPKKGYVRRGNPDGGDKSPSLSSEDKTNGDSNKSEEDDDNDGEDSSSSSNTYDESNKSSSSESDYKRKVKGKFRTKNKKRKLSKTILRRREGGRERSQGGPA